VIGELGQRFSFGDADSNRNARAAVNSRPYPSAQRIEVAR